MAKAAIPRRTRAGAGPGMPGPGPEVPCPWRVSVGEAGVIGPVDGGAVVDGGVEVDDGTAEEVEEAESGPSSIEAVNRMLNGGTRDPAGAPGAVGRR